jgi:GTPase SAR1 family protein
MATQQDRPRVPNVKFRVLIIGRANAGKTSILQRVCDTTESPEVYRLDRWGTRYRVRPRSYGDFRISSSGQVKLNPTIEVWPAYYCWG